MSDSSVDNTTHTVFVHPVDEQDITFCANLLPKVSRTFALSITVLPPALREAIRIAYLLCRIVDTIEDDAVVRGAEREALFDLFDELMGDDKSDPRRLERRTAELDLGAGSDDQVLCLGAGSVFRCFRALPLAQRVAVRPHVLEMSRGMREYTQQADEQGKLRLYDMAELERYCYFVAGTVGKLLTSLFEVQVPGLPAHVLTAVRGRAISFGLALQMVNIVKDVATDLPRGDCFLPVELAEQRGIALEDILAEENREAGLAIIAAVCERAREHLKRAEEYTLAWPVEEGRDVRMFCSVPLTLAAATLHEVERGDDTLRPGRTPKVSRDTVLRVFKDSHHAIRANDTLGWMFSYYASGAYLGEAPSSRRAWGPPASVRPGASSAVSSAPASSAAGSWAGADVIPASEPPASTSRVVRFSAGAPTLPREFVKAKRSDREPLERRFEGKVLVTGAAGHLGANLVRRLLDEGRDVRVMLRAGSNNAAMDGLEVERSYADLRDPVAVNEAVKGVESIFHCAAMVSTLQGDDAHKRDVWSSNVVGAAHLLDAALDHDVERVVVTGSFSATGYHDDSTQPAAESLPFYPFATHLPYARCKSQVEHECLKRAVEGLDVVMCTSTAILGPHDYKPSRMGQTLLDFAHGKLRAYIPGGFEFVAAHDIVEGHMLAMERGRCGQKYTIATQFLTLGDIMGIFERVTGRPRPKLELNARAMYALAHVSSFVMTNFFPDKFQRFTPDAVRILRLGRRADISKARRELGFEPSSIEDAVAEAYDDFARRGLAPRRQGARRVPVHATRPREVPSQDSKTRSTRSAGGAVA